MENADSAALLCPEYGGNIMMKRRIFLRILVAGIFGLFAKTVKAEKKSDTHLTMAMFWKKVD